MISISKISNAAPDGSDRQSAPIPVDGEATERFRAAMARGEKREGAREKARPSFQERDERPERPDGERPLAGQAMIVPRPGHQTLPPNPIDDKDGGVATMAAPTRHEIRAERPMVAAGPSTSSPLSGSEFSTILARLDAGSPSSTLTQLNLPGSDWTAHQIIVTHRDDMLAVVIKTDQDAATTPTTLEELRRRLRARGIHSQIEAEMEAGPYEEDGSFPAS